LPESKHRRRRGRALPRSARSAGTLAVKPRRKKTNKVYLFASALIALLVIAGFAIGGVVGGGRSSLGTQVGDSDRFVEGLGVQQPIAISAHAAEGVNIEYPSFPPTSGNHWPPNALVTCGFYEDGVPDERVVHHLEHSNIVVSYNLIDPAQVDRLRQAVDDIGLLNIWGVTRFYDKIPVGQVALTAWGVLDVIEGVDKDRINRFVDNYAGTLGPERAPCRG